MLRVILPYHLQNIANCPREISLEIAAPLSQRALLDALEEKFPTLRGTIRDHGATKRRPLLRFFAAGEDISNVAPDAPLPEAVISGREPFCIVGAMAGG